MLSTALSLWFYLSVLALASTLLLFLWWRIDLWLWQRLALRRKAELQAKMPPGWTVTKVYVQRDGRVLWYEYEFPAEKLSIYTLLWRDYQRRQQQKGQG